ncbi:MAG: 3-hydroxyacyl-CoA dehydrogenase NAD-binding domain-containing protein [Bacteroidota bacterium]|nr:3-hydroxyacyl-CoA dehydrogenase NAD-binding domain-containing protein [Bacteroidota bacterium]MDP4227086.1 3-hydroxyacyl-CoA dehydrogenase NAD-binding domain-containing protein [Bacteroidota bacterium]MDP4273706.1 3-hydroxyacyl-CoA dehydrogenase NAD-binding domain-containing protein [Bacteroidota bacterium]
MPELLEDFSLSKQNHKKGSIQKIGIVGCGNVGQEIARLLSQYGLEVIYIEKNTELVEEVFGKIKKQLDEAIDKWGLTEGDKRAILSRIKGSTEYSSLSNCDLVIEAIYSYKTGSSLDERREIFRNIEQYVSEETVICSNSSTLMISDIASFLQHPERSMGLHFLSPETTVKIVEVVRGLNTNDETYDFVCKFAKMIEKKVITVNESPGNISTRLICTLINEACETLMEGVASVQDIDDTMKLGFGLQVGPLELADKLGLDKILKYMDNLYAEFGLQKFKASPIIKRLVRANHLGRKTLKGFYSYDGERKIGEAISCPEYKL